MKLLIATKNPGKLGELRRFLNGDFNILSLSDFLDAPDIEESGKTFEENAVIKARAYFEWARMPTVADDGGLEIDFLNGEPGVISRRWPGYEATDEELINMALKKLESVPQERRTAHLRTVGAYCDGKNIVVESAGIDGFITENYDGRCERGYPFRSIFWVPQFKKLFRDLTDEEHNAINHRKIVYGKLKERILKLHE